MHGQLSRDYRGSCDGGEPVKASRSSPRAICRRPPLSMQRRCTTSGRRRRRISGRVRAAEGEGWQRARGQLKGGGAVLLISQRIRVMRCAAWVAAKANRRGCSS